MKCEHFKDVLVDFVYDELDDVQSAQLKEHADTCVSCKQELDDFEAVRQVSASLPVPEIPTSFDNAIMEMARAKAATFDRTEDAVAMTGPTVTAAPTVWEKLAAFLFKPQIALPMVAAAVVVAVVTTNTDMSSEMLAPTETTTSKSAVKTENRPEEAMDTKPEAMLQQAGGDSSGIEEAEEHDKETAQLKTKGSGLVQKKDLERRARNQNLADQLPQPKKRAAAPQKSALNTLLGARRSAPSSGSGAATAGTATESKETVARKKAAPQMAYNAPPASQAMEDAVAESELAADLDAVAPSAPAEKQEATGTRAQLAIAMYNKGNYKSAVMYFQQALKAAPKEGYSRVELYHYLARSYKNMGNCARAVKYYESIIKKYTGYSKLSAAKSEAAACYDKLGSAQRAMELRK